jgi:hypothetical protein
LPPRRRWEKRGAGLLQHIVAVPAGEVNARHLPFEQPLVAAQQPPKGELVAGLVGSDQPAQLGRRRLRLRAAAGHQDGMKWWCVRWPLLQRPIPSHPAALATH